jgi:signal transduction histidine kinase
VKLLPLIIGWLLLFGTLTGQSQSAPPAPPVLQTALAVRELTPAEVRRNYSVRLRAVVLARDVTREGALEAVLQDATSPVFVFLNSPAARAMRLGHLYEITGVVRAGNFAPFVEEKSAVDLGPAPLPEPLHPSFDELVGGSLDCDWVELEGIPRPAGPVGLQLLMKGGHVNLRLSHTNDFAAVLALTNAWVKLRGCAIPYRTAAGEVTGAALILVPSADFVQVERPAPENPFALPQTRVADLLRFDPRKRSLPWTKLAGVISRVRGETVFLLDGTDGARCLAQNTAGLAAGDLVEAVGLADFGGSAPVLRDAVLRKTGHADLPPARLVTVEEILPLRRESTNIQQNAQIVRDAARVQLEGRLVNVRATDAELILEMQSELRVFQAFLPNAANHRQALPPIGSTLRLTGVVAGWEQPAGGQAGAFDLLLNTPDDIQLLQLPPRWTLRDALIVVAGLLVVVALAALWIFQLRRRVEQSTRQLRVEMEERRRVEDRVRTLEMQTALEKERIRIARNIHDELGARATRINLLAVTARPQTEPTGANRQFQEISAAAQQLVRALDETVWTVNPGNDSLANLLDYLTHYAEEFFRATPVRCQLKIPVDVPDCPLSTERRHSLLAIVKEALNNTLKHAGAKTAVISAQLEDGRLRLVIQDDGRGFSPAASAHGNGLANLRARAAAIGAKMEIESAPGCGVIIRVELPLAESPVGI